MEIRRLGNVRAILGEGPLWDAQDQMLYFLDIRGRELWRYDPQTETFRSWKTPLEPVALSRTVDGGFVVALADGIYDFDLDTGRFTPIAQLDLDITKVQLNDGKVDRQGRFLIGATDRKIKEPIADVYSFDGTSLTVVDTAYTCCNGPCWSPDGGTFYLADTIPNKLFAYGYDQSTGRLSNRRLFADGGQVGGMADGATVDSEGRLWMAFCGEGRIACFNPDGSLNRIVQTDVKWVASVAFGGENLDKLYVVSFDPEKVAGLPADENSGYLYVIEGLGAIGLPEPLAKVSAVTAA